MLTRTERERRFRKAQALVLTAVRHNGPVHKDELFALCYQQELVNESQEWALFDSLMRRNLIERHNGHNKFGEYYRAAGWYKLME